MNKEDFLVFEKEKDLVYLDSAASALKPKVVTERIKYFLDHEFSNIHRGVYKLSQKATELYDESKEVVAGFIGAKASEIVYTKNATEGLNLLANSLSKICKDKNEIVLTEMEHHANIVPWQKLQDQGFILKFIPIKEDLSLDYEKAAELINENTAIVSFVHVSNTTGINNDVEELVKLAKEVDALTILDASQSIVHSKVDVKDLDVDFMVFSGHKLYGPSGIGVVYGREGLLQIMPPFLTGGDMIEKVEFYESTYAKSPQKFEAGTPNIEGAIGLAEAIKFLESIGMDKVESHEKELFDYCKSQMEEIGIKMLNSDGSIISFNMKAHPHDIASLLDDKGICVRAGHHCAMPLMNKLNLPGTARVSFGIYNTKEDVDKLIERLKEIKVIFNE